MHDENGRESMARVGRQREVGVWLVLEQSFCRVWSIKTSGRSDVGQHTSIIANHRPLAAASIWTVTQHAKVDIAVGRDGDSRDDRRGNGRQ